MVSHGHPFLVKASHGSPRLEGWPRLGNGRKAGQGWPRSKVRPKLAKAARLDKACKGNYPAWILRTYGDTMKYAMANPLHGAKQYSVVVVKSTVWPGALSYFWQGQWGELYMGDGQKHEDVTYFPVQPPQICADPDERPCNEEVSYSPCFLDPLNKT